MGLVGPEVWGRQATGRAETGELLVCNTVSALSRRGRKEVRTRVVGDRSLGWLEVAEGWGARIDAVVHGRKPCPVLEQKFSHLNRIDSDTAYYLPPRDAWDGVLLATMGEEEDAALIRRLLGRWKPRVAIVAVPSHASRIQRRLWLQGWKHFRQWHVKHQDLGGVTAAKWTLVHVSRDPSLQELKGSSLMTALTYPRPLQTALDDTEPGGGARLIAGTAVRRT